MESPPFRQRVPRPPSVRLGPPPPWAGLPLALRSSVAVERLIAAVSAGTPPDPPTGVTAAVLVPVFSGERAEATIVFIRRASQLQRDPGHVAFPGGRVEPGEAPEAAALREAEEEIGLSRSDVEVHGLVDVVGRRSGEQIAAYLGLLNRRPVHMPNASEVDSVIEVPVARLLSDGVAWRERWLTGAEERSVEFFADPVTLQDDLIWGVSARILWRVLELVARPG